MAMPEMKRIKCTNQQCLRCKNGKTHLYLYQRENGDHVLKCRKCNLTCWLTPGGMMLAIEPFDAITFPNQQTAINKCVELIAELT